MPMLSDLIHPHRDIPPGFYVPGIRAASPKVFLDRVHMYELIWPQFHISQLTAAEVLSLQSAGLIDKIAGRWIVTEKGHRANEFRSI